MSEIHSGVGSYVVDALDADEREQFEAHLAVCETCRQEVIELSETAAELSRLAETQPPPALRASILTAIKEVRPLPPEVPRPEVSSAGPATGSAPDSSAPDSSAPYSSRPNSWGAGPSDAAVPDELAVRRQRRVSRLLTLAVAATLVVALALGGWVYTLVQQRQSQVAQATAESQLFSAPDTKVYAAALPGGQPVSFVVSKSLDKAMFVGPDLPSPGTGKKYQLWTIPPGQAPVPDSLFDGGPGRKQWFTHGVRTAASLAVTIEPARGSTAPTTAPLAAVDL